MPLLGKEIIMKYKSKLFYTVAAALFSLFIINISHGLAQDMMENQAQEYFQEGIEAQKSGDVDRAISLYTKAIYFNPNYAKAYNNLGTAYKQKRDYAKAEEEYNKALMIDPDYSIALKNMAVMYAERKDYDKFYEYWKRATGLNAVNPFLIDDEDYGEDD